MRRFPLRNRARGSILVPLVVVVLLCGALSFALIAINVSTQQEANVIASRERAYQLAEAGVDWSLTQIRANNGRLPDEPLQVIDPDDTGNFTIRSTRGDANGVDDDGDGTVDEGDEDSFASVISTGEAGGVRRSLRVVLNENVEVPTFDGALQFNVDYPIVDLRGNSFLIDGRDHDLAGELVDGADPEYGLSSPADVAYIVEQIDENRQDQVIGAGAPPSVAQVDPVALDQMMDYVASGHDILLPTGTITTTYMGGPSASEARIVYAPGDVHLSGNGEGGGLLAVDGDLTITGSFTWTGIVLVRGRVRFSGGGSVKQIIGALVVGEEVTAETSSTEVSVNGNVKIAYSAEAIAIAARRLAVMTVVAVTEVGNP